MSIYISAGHKPVSAATLDDAARIFADRAARRLFGRAGYCRKIELQGWSEDGSYGETEAFVGRDVRPYRDSKMTETQGRNIRFSVQQRGR